MGSLCSVPGRRIEPARSNEDHRRSNGGLSSSFSSRRATVSMDLHRASLSSTRSDRGFGSSDLLPHPHDIIFNSPFEPSPPSESFTLAEVGNTSNAPSEPKLRSSQALLHQKDSGTSAVSVSLESASQKECGSSGVSPSLEALSHKLSENSKHEIHSRKSRYSQNLSSSTPGVSAVSSHALSRKTSASSGICIGSSSTRVPMDLESLQHRPGSNVDLLPRGTSKNRESWTTHSFSELVETIQLENARWPNVDISYDQEDIRELGLPYIQGHSATHHQRLVEVDQEGAQECALCTKMVSHRSPWSSTDVPIVGILVCGHVFHAECLEQATPLTHIHDPPCPQCNAHEKDRKVQRHGIIGNTSKRHGITGQTYVKGKLSRVCVATDDLTGTQSVSKSAHVSGKVSSSLDTSRKGGSHSEKSLLKRQFSLRGMLGRDPAFGNSGSKKPGSPARVSPENHAGQSPRDKGSRKVNLHSLGYMKAL